MMTDTLKALQESRRVAKMRMGQQAPDFVALKSTEDSENPVRVALVPLTEAEYQRALDAAASLPVNDNPYGIEARDRVLQVYTLFHAVREVSDPDKRVFKSVEQLTDSLEEGDVNQLGDQYQRMVEFSSPALDGLGEEELEALKKALTAIDLSVLSGKPWWHLKGLFSTLTVDQLRASSLSPSSIQSLTGKNDEPESTPGASPS